MNRSFLAFFALLGLLSLTGITWLVADGSPAIIALVAGLKIAVIGAVFLDLDRAWPGWAALSAAVVGAVLGGAVLILGG